MRNLASIMSYMVSVSTGFKRRGDELHVKLVWHVCMFGYLILCATELVCLSSSVCVSTLTAASLGRVGWQFFLTNCRTVAASDEFACNGLVVCAPTEEEKCLEIEPHWEGSVEKICV